MTNYTVKSPVVDYTGEVAGVALVRGEYNGPLTAAALAYFQGAGYVVFPDVPVDLQPVDPAPAPAPEGGPAAPGRSASKSDWVAYATHEDRGSLRLLPDAAEALTRDQLAEKYLGKKEDS